MKKVFIVLVMTAGAFMAKAQHVELGVKGGLNVSTQSNGNDPVSNDPKISGHIGGLAHIHLDKSWAIQPELVLSGEGFKYKGDRYNLTYLNVPVLAQYMFGEGFRVETGPQVGFLLNANVKNNNVRVTNTSAYRDVDFSWAFGAGYLLPVGLGFDARFNAGLSKVNDNNSPTRRNGVFQVGVFYQFKKLHR